MRTGGWQDDQEGAGSQSGAAARPPATSSRPADAEFAGATDVVNGKDVLGEYGKKEGVEFRWNTELVELMQDADGSVTGAICQGPDGCPGTHRPSGASSSSAAAPAW